ncbi:MAG: hypothetical protein SPE49_05730, partial [Campylobacter sp.]|uniref:hypothetical protein n=1 Tax=Campylobacter sp. TaxID=205 RepID=UPI002A810E65
RLFTKKPNPKSRKILPKILIMDRIITKIYKKSIKKANRGSNPSLSATYFKKSLNIFLKALASTAFVVSCTLILAVLRSFCNYAQKI